MDLPLPPLFQDLFTAYEALRQAKQMQLEHRRPYRAYIAWLEQQDVEMARAFWRSVLQGFTILLRSRSIKRLGLHQARAQATASSSGSSRLLSPRRCTVLRASSTSPLVPLSRRPGHCC